MPWHSALHCFVRESDGTHCIIDRSPEKATDCTYGCKVVATEMVHDRLPQCTGQVRYFTFCKNHEYRIAGQGRPVHGVELLTQFEACSTCKRLGTLKRKHARDKHVTSCLMTCPKFCLLGLLVATLEQRTLHLPQSTRCMHRLALQHRLPQTAQRHKLLALHANAKTG